MERRWKYPRFPTSGHRRGEEPLFQVTSHISSSRISFFCAAEEKQVALPEAAVSHGRAVQFPAELRSQPSTIRLAFFFFFFIQARKPWLLAGLLALAWSSADTWPRHFGCSWTRLACVLPARVPPHYTAQPCWFSRDKASLCACPDEPWGAATDLSVWGSARIMKLFSIYTQRSLRFKRFLAKQLVV